MPSGRGGSSSGDSTPLNRLCLGCHNDTSPTYNGQTVSQQFTHSSTETSTTYGVWQRECVACHNPHYQRQLRTYRSSTFLNTGTLTSVDTGNTPDIVIGDTLNENYEGYLFVPSTTYWMMAYRVINDTTGTNTFKVRGPVNKTYAMNGGTYAFVYGKLIHESIGGKAVKFFGPTGNNSFADGDGTMDGICEVCHTKPTHFRGNGTGSDQKHMNLTGGGAKKNCIMCHEHTAGLAHGGVGSGCGDAVSCHGLVRSHPTHVGGDSGFTLVCADCHDTDEFPFFKSGTDGNADGKYNKSETDVCDACHSSGGAFNGVASVGNSVGAKDNWATRARTARTQARAGLESSTAQRPTKSITPTSRSSIQGMPSASPTQTSRSASTETT